MSIFRMVAAGYSPGVARRGIEEVLKFVLSQFEFQEALAT